MLLSTSIIRKTNDTRLTLLSFSSFPLLHFADHDGLRANEFPDFQHLGIVRMLQLDDLLLEHFVELRLARPY